MKFIVNSKNNVSSIIKRKRPVGVFAWVFPPGRAVKTKNPPLYMANSDLREPYSHNRFSETQQNNWNYIGAFFRLSPRRFNHQVFNNMDKLTIRQQRIQIRPKTRFHLPFISIRQLSFAVRNFSEVVAKTTHTV